MWRAACARWRRCWCWVASHGGWPTKASLRLRLGEPFRVFDVSADLLAIGRSHRVGNDGQFARPGLGVAADAEEPCWPRALACVSLNLVHVGQRRSPLVFASLAFFPGIVCCGAGLHPTREVPLGLQDALERWKVATAPACSCAGGHRGGCGTCGGGGAGASYI